MNIFRLMCFGLVIVVGSIPIASAEKPIDAAAKRYPQPVRVGDLLRRQVQLPLESQPSLGNVRAVVISPTGMIEIVIDYGGILGFFTRPIALPVEAVALSGHYVFVLGYSPDQLDRLPDFVSAGKAPLIDDAIIQVGLAKPAH